MPVMHLLAGPNGAGKSTYVSRVIRPVTHLPFVNADLIAAERWPDAPSEHAYEASRAAEAERQRFLLARRSFITETVFSHPSKVELTEQAVSIGYLVHLHVMLIPLDVAVHRVAERVHRGGHDVPERKIRQRYERLWSLIVSVRDRVDRVEFFDNSRAGMPFRLVASYEQGRLLDEARWPRWAPPTLVAR